MAHHMGLSDGETQSSLKQSPAPVLFVKRAPAVLNTRSVIRQQHSFISVPEPFDMKTASCDPNRTRINLQHQAGKMI